MKIHFDESLIENLKKIQSIFDKTKYVDALLDIAENGADDEKLTGTVYNYIKLSTKDNTNVSAQSVKKIAKYLKENGTEPTSEVLDTLNDEMYTDVAGARSAFKPNKILSKIYIADKVNELVSDSDKEKFTYQWKAVVSSPYELKVVDGEDILKYYLEENVDSDVPSGTLRGSCMRQSEKNKFMKLYANEPNIRMLVALNSENGKVVARSILWEKVNIYKNMKTELLDSDTKFMDRIYHSHEWLREYFIAWGNSNGYWCRNNQGTDDPNSVFKDGKVESNAVIEAKIDFKYEFYPYLDTLRYANYSGGYLTNKSDYVASVTLQNQSSGKPSHGYDNITGTAYELDNMRWSEYHKSYIHRNAVLNVDDEKFHKLHCKKDAVGTFITPKDEVVKCAVTENEFAKRNMLESKYHKGFIHKNKAVVISEDNIHVDSTVKSEILNGIDIIKDDAVELPNGDFVPGFLKPDNLSPQELFDLLEKVKSLGIQQNEVEEDVIMEF